jgi:V8-like Glu-specific endopeptidase
MEHDMGRGDLTLNDKNLLFFIEAMDGQAKHPWSHPAPSPYTDETEFVESNENSGNATIYDIDFDDETQSVPNENLGLHESAKEHWLSEQINEMQFADNYELDDDAGEQAVDPWLDSEGDFEQEEGFAEEDDDLIDTYEAVDEGEEVGAVEQENIDFTAEEISSVIETSEEDYVYPEVQDTETLSNEGFAEEVVASDEYTAAPPPAGRVSWHAITSLPREHSVGSSLARVGDTENAPFRYICLIVANVGASQVERGTGIVVGPRHVLTTAHSLVDGGSLISPVAISVDVGVDRDNLLRESGVKKIITPRGFKPGDEVTENDFALLELDASMAKDPGIWGSPPSATDDRGSILGWIPGWTSGFKANMAGYRLRKPDDVQFHSYDTTVKKSQGYIDHLSSRDKGAFRRGRLIAIKHAIEPGMSGSPVWVTRHKSMGGRFAVAMVLGVHRLTNGHRISVALTIGSRVTKFIARHTGQELRKPSYLANEIDRRVEENHSEGNAPLYNETKTKSAFEVDDIGETGSEEEDILIDDFFEESEEASNVYHGKNADDWVVEAREVDGVDASESWGDNVAPVSEDISEDNVEGLIDMEFASGSLARKVHWYQSILKYVLKFSDVPLNGKHNDPDTRARMKEIQRHWGLKKVNGYLTVESNAALTESALNWIYSKAPPASQVKGRWDSQLKETLRRFQYDNDLEDDGKLGPKTRTTMVRVLKELYEKEKRDDDIKKKNKKQDDKNRGKRKAKGGDGGKNIRGRSKVKRSSKREIDDTIREPFRWICYLDIDIPRELGKEVADHYGHGSGVLISPYHVLTCAHNLMSFNEEETKFWKVRSIRAYPAYDNAPLAERYHNKKPFGQYMVDIQRSFVPKPYIQAWKKKEHLSDWDFAVLRLEEPIDGYLVPKKLSFRRGTDPYPKPIKVGNWLGNNNAISVATNDERTELGDIDIKGTGPGKWNKLAGQELFCAGYPGLSGLMFLNNGLAMPKSCITTPQYSGTDIEGKIRYFKHSLRMAGGSSGSPVWTIRKMANGGIRREVIGIHITGRKSYEKSICYDHKTGNRYFDRGGAVAITPEVIRLICEYASDTFAPSYRIKRPGLLPEIVGMHLKKASS